MRSSQGNDASEPASIFLLELSIVQYHSLSCLLNDDGGHHYATKYGLSANYKLTHLMYLDKIKLYLGADTDMIFDWNFVQLSAEFKSFAKFITSRMPAIALGTSNEANFDRYLGFLQGTFTRDGDL